VRASINAWLIAAVLKRAKIDRTLRHPLASGAIDPPSPTDRGRAERPTHESEGCAMKGFSLVGVAAAVLAISTPALARFYLTESDFAYLATLNFDTSKSIIRSLGPREEATLHAAINDQKTEKNPSDRAKIVTDTLAQFMSHRRWEQLHPGQVWRDQPLDDREGQN
jgi:hypothetical protein